MVDSIYISDEKLEEYATEYLRRPEDYLFTII